jgi:S1-C subfamily serine protease
MTQDITPEIARYLNMSCEPRGVVVTDVVYSPLQPGDVIVAVNGNPVSCQAELNEQLGQLGSAETFTISVLRDDAIQTITIQRAMAVPTPTCLEGHRRSTRNERCESAD